MIYAMTQVVADALTAANLKHKVHELEHLSYVEASFSGDNCDCTIRAITSEKSPDDLKIMSADFAKYPSSRLEKAYPTINRLNGIYKYAKFTLDTNDGGICIQYDIPNVKDPAISAKIAVEIMLRFSNIVDDSYPEIMKSIWA